VFFFFFFFTHHPDPDHLDALPFLLFPVLLMNTG